MKQRLVACVRGAMTSDVAFARLNFVDAFADTRPPADLRDEIKIAFAIARFADQEAGNS
jgi:hypothetical protein